MNTQKNFKFSREIANSIYDKALSIRCVEQTLLADYANRHHLIFDD